MFDIVHILELIHNWKSLHCHSPVFLTCKIPIVAMFYSEQRYPMVIIELNCDFPLWQGLSKWKIPEVIQGNWNFLSLLKTHFKSLFLHDAGLSKWEFELFIYILYILGRPDL